jgi:hypothetical protein
MIEELSASEDNVLHGPKLAGFVGSIAFKLGPAFANGYDKYSYCKVRDDRIGTPYFRLQRRSCHPYASSFDGYQLSVCMSALASALPLEKRIAIAFAQTLGAKQRYWQSSRLWIL